MDSFAKYNNDDLSVKQLGFFNDSKSQEIVPGTESGVSANLDDRSFNLFDLIHPPKPRMRKEYVCPKFGPRWAVITTINYPSEAIKVLSKLENWIVLIVADAKTPKDWFKNDPELGLNTSNVVLLTMEQQKELDFDLIDVIPENSYARKNIGYLCAIKCGAMLIYETDDDNKLMDGVGLNSIDPKLSMLEAIPPETSSKPLVNPYAFFGHSEIPPRGFPLQFINMTHDYEFYNVRTPPTPINPWIQQSLANLDPDVDAIYRMTRSRILGTIKFRPYPEAIAIAKGYFAPYNTQNTIYMEQAFWGLLIPYTTTFRVCDIWRGYWVQRLLWDVGGSLVFRPPTVNQYRNVHNYFKDFIEEQDLYMKSEELIDFLEKWDSSKTDMFERILELGKHMSMKKFWSYDEVKLIKAWISDLKRIGYKPPKLVSKLHKAPKHPVDLQRTAICLTGQLDRLSKSWPTTEATLHKFFDTHSQPYDLFYYISTYGSPNQEDEEFLKSKIHPTYGILYDDPPISPNVSTKNFQLSSNIRPKNYFQQLYALKRCYEMVEKWSRTNNIRHSYLMRLRTDHFWQIGNLSHIDEAWTAVKNENKVIIPLDELEFEHKHGIKNWVETENDWISDRMAFGPMDSMKYYMKRYEYMDMPGLKTLHAETFLHFVLKNFNVSVARTEWIYQEVFHRK